MQWHPPEQLSVAADTQSVDDSTAVAIPSSDGYQEEQSYQEEEDYDTPKGEYGRDKFFYTPGADLGGGCRGCAPPPPRDDLRFSNTTGILQKKKQCGLLVLK